MPTLRDVARMAGVSVGTASQALSGTAPVSSEKRDRVLAAVRKLRYQPNHIARSLKMQRTRTLGLIVTDITNPFFSQLVRGAEEAALERNYLVLNFNTDDRIEREKRVLDVLTARRVDGVMLVVAPNGMDVSHIRALRRLRLPLVCLDRMPPGVKVDSVRVDNAGAARDCVRHLIELGHRRIGIITGSLELQTARDRLQGYKAALRAAGISLDPSLVWVGNFRAESGYELTRKLVHDANRPTALFVSNGLMALGVLKALTELKFLIPEDIALASFDELPLSDVIRPRLTTVAQPAYLMGYCGTELLVELIESRSKRRSPKTIVLPTELKIRESTAEPADNKT